MSTGRASEKAEPPIVIRRQPSTGAWYVHCRPCANRFQGWESTQERALETGLRHLRNRDHSIFGTATRAGDGHPEGRGDVDGVGWD